VKNRAAKLSSLALVSILLSVLVTPSANSVPEGVTYTGDTRTVPIFAVFQEGGQQPAQVVSTGFLYSSRIVFTAGVQEKFFDQAKGGIYVGKPGSRTTDKSGRVKVIKAFYPKSGNAELDDFVVFVLEKDLVSVEPFPLLQIGQESSAREASVRGYGEYLNRCGPGAQGPCPEKPTSEVPRQINVNVIPLSQAENLVGYERSQLSGQIILQNARNAQDGVVCRGDTGSPVIGNFGGTGIYLGAASKAMNAKICGAVGVEKVERDKPKVSASFDGIAGITHIAPVYRFSSEIDEARKYAAQTPTPTPTATPTPTPTSTQKPEAVKIENSKYQAGPNVSAEQHEIIKVIYPGNLSKKTGEVTGFRIYNSKDKGGSLLAGQVLLKDLKCEFDKNTTCYLNKYRYLAISHNQGITKDRPAFKGNKGVGISVAAYNSKGEGARSDRLPFPICPRYVFIGMRGSGEAFSDKDPIGATNNVVYELLRGHDKINFNILEDGVPNYKAAKVDLTANYLNEVVNSSTNELAIRFGEIYKVCNQNKTQSEGTKFFLSGYSQGAYGVNDLINIWEKRHGTEVKDLVEGVFLVANPAQPNTGIITALDSGSEADPGGVGSLAICGASATIRDALLISTEKGALLTRKSIEALNLVRAGIKNFTSILANPLKILGLSSGPQMNDTELSKEFKKTLKNYEKAAAEVKKNANPKDIVWCNLLFARVILKAYDRNLTEPIHVKVYRHFAPGDVVADFETLSIDVALDFAGGRNGRIGAVATTTQVATTVIESVMTHTAYKYQCFWAREAISKVVAPPIPQINEKGSFAEQFLSEKHPCRNP
jgi:hypothetical protein